MGDALMGAVDLTARGRLHAEALMVDRCSIRRASGTVTNGGTGVASTTYAIVYVGACRVQDAGVGTDAESGEANHGLAAWVVSVPLSVTGVQPRDEVVMASSPMDADLAGRVFTVTGVLHKTFATARRLRCEEVQS